MKTIIEKKSERKKKAIIQLVQNGEYSIAFAMIEAERLNDEGKLLDNDYEELAEWLESLLEPVIEEVIEDGADTDVATIEEPEENETTEEVETPETEVE